jgi:alpha-glucosidase
LREEHVGVTDEVAIIQIDIFKRYGGGFKGCCVAVVEMFFRQKLAKDWARVDSPENCDVQLRTPSDHSFGITVVEDGILRVVYQLPEKYNQSKKTIKWEQSDSLRRISNDKSSSSIETNSLKVKVEWDVTPRLKWYKKPLSNGVANGHSNGFANGHANGVANGHANGVANGHANGFANGHANGVANGHALANGISEEAPFMEDLPTRAYAYDAATGSVYHYVTRELYLPKSEDEGSAYVKKPGESLYDREEFIYGLGESRGPLLKGGKKFTMEGRDALAYDWEEGDTLYKLNPFYIVHNRRANIWYGIWYNTLCDSVVDMGAECDVMWGSFRSFTAKRGPLDYYMIFGDGSLPSVVSGYARLISPAVPNKSFATSSLLPPLSQFGYLASSMSMAELNDAQKEVVGFIEKCRQEGFPIDGLYLSSGWCQDDEDNRLYFVWNEKKYPNPALFAKTIEKDLQVAILINIKPWLLKIHPYFREADKQRSLVGAASDSDTVSDHGSSLTWLWSKGFGTHDLGSYFDFSSTAGNLLWRKCIHESLFKYGISGLWNDNNEFSSILDDEDVFKGEVSFWQDGVEDRMGWGGGSTTAGNVGRAVQTIGMLRASFDAHVEAYPDKRPVIVSRSYVPGSQAYAHASWGGDNTTTWKSLKYSTKMTLSVGLSVGPGLYGHDIGGFAGKNNPSPELLVRWCQQGAWHTRFTVHSWKDISTTLWMYDEVKPLLRDIVSWRYRLAPSLYSFYITHYYQNGWPVLKPLFWYHSKDDQTLVVDEQFIFGDSVLVAPVLDKDVSKLDVYLPSKDDSSSSVSWCDVDDGKWYYPEQEGSFVTIDTPLEKCPTFAKSGSILVLGGECQTTIYDGTNERYAYVFGAPGVKSSGEFRLIEDDGKSNDHTRDGAYTELVLRFEANENEVVVDIDMVHQGYDLPYKSIRFVLPQGDEREIRSRRRQSSNADHVGKTMGGKQTQKAVDVLV